MQGAIFGKHPAYGDFLSGGVSPAGRRLLEGWCEDWIGGLKAHFGDFWPQFWDHAPPLRLWIGEAVVGEVICGVMCPSQDRVGRRHPLFALLTGSEPQMMPDPPVLGPDHAFYDQLEAALLELPDTGGASAIAEALPLPEVAASLAGPEAFWAERTGGSEGVEAAHLHLIADVALADHRRAAAGRCYLWTRASGVSPARFHAGPGLPETAVLQWLLTSPTEVEASER